MELTEKFPAGAVRRDSSMSEARALPMRAVNESAKWTPVR